LSGKISAVKLFCRFRRKNVSQKTAILKTTGEKNMSKITLIFSLVAFAIFAAACGSSADSAGKTIKSGAAGNNLTVTLANAEGVLRREKRIHFDLCRRFGQAG
jgi:predicted small secreted protein